MNVNCLPKIIQKKSCDLFPLLSLKKRNNSIMYEKTIIGHGKDKYLTLAFKTLFTRVQYKHIGGTEPIWQLLDYILTLLDNTWFTLDCNWLG